MKLIRSILIVTLFLTVTLVFADNNQMALTANEIIEKIRKAADPDGKLVNAETKLTEGEITMPIQQVKAIVKTYFKKPCKFMVETYFPNGTVEKGGYDGKTAWKKAFNSEKIVELKGKDRNSFILSSYLESPDTSVWHNVFSNISLDRKLQEAGGVLCYKLTCIPKVSFGISSPVVFFIDSKNFLIRRMDMSSYSNEKEFRQNVIVTEYKDFDKVMVTSKTKTDVMGAEIDYNITKFELNKNLDEKLFSIQIK